MIAGFHTATEQSLNYEEPPFSAVFLAAHPELSLAELARLFKRLKDHALFTQIDWPVVVQALGWHWNQHLEKVLLLVADTPLEFQHWSSARKFGIRDFSPLASLPSIDSLQPLLLQLARHNLGYHHGRNLLEWGVELILMGTTAGEINKSGGENEAEWMQRVQSLRFPQSFSNEQKAQAVLKSLPVPPHTSIDWKRQGDLAGLQVEFFAHSREELRKKLERLQHFHGTLNQDTGLPWRN